MNPDEREIVSAKPKGRKGITFGGGESQLEIERREVKSRITKINKELSEIKEKHTRQIEKRASQIGTIALVGYTNAGNTAIINLMTGSELSSKNILFETLESATRE